LDFYPPAGTVILFGSLPSSNENLNRIISTSNTEKRRDLLENILQQISVSAKRVGKTSILFILRVFSAKKAIRQGHGERIMKTKNV